MLNEALTALQEAPFATFLRHARWTYATVNATHIVGVALLFGAITPLDLRMLGVWRSVPLASLARVLVPVAIAGLILAVGAGFFLFSIRATEYAALPLFRVKLALIVLAAANALLLRRVARWEEGAQPMRLAVAGALSIVLWLSVIVCGRMMAFLD